MAGHPHRLNAKSNPRREYVPFDVSSLVPPDHHRGAPDGPVVMTVPLAPGVPRPLSVRVGTSLLKGSLSSSSWAAIRSGHGSFVRGLRGSLRNPIFVVGAPRSGTTMLGCLLSTSDAVSYHYEPGLTKAATRYVYENLWRTTTSRFVFRSTYALLMASRRETGLRFVEKTPQASHIVPFLAAAFPDSTFVHIIRDGRDAATSLLAKPWYRAEMAYSGLREPGGYSFGPYPRFWVEQERLEEFAETTDFHRCIWTWRAFTAAALKGTATFPDRTVTVRYEEVVRDPERTVGELFATLAIAPGPNYADAVRDVTATSVGSWRKQLSAAEVECAETEAGDLLHRLAYAD